MFRDHRQHQLRNQRDDDRQAHVEERLRDLLAELGALALLVAAMHRQRAERQAKHGDADYEKGEVVPGRDRKDARVQQLQPHQQPADGKDAGVEGHG